MKNTFTKQDLLTGDIIVLRDGTLGIVILEKDVIIYQNSGRDYLENFTDDLKFDMCDEESDICEVYRDYDGDAIDFRTYKSAERLFVREDFGQEEFNDDEREECYQDQKKSLREDYLFVVTQAFYGNRTGTSIKKDELDALVLGFTDMKHLRDEQVDRTLIPVPGTNNLVIVYNKYQEEEKVKSRGEFFEDFGYEKKPLAMIPELDITLYSRCIMCRIDENGELQSIKAEDWDMVEKYFAE